MHATRIETQGAGSDLLARWTCTCGDHGQWTQGISPAWTRRDAKASAEVHRRDARTIDALCRQAGVR